MGGGGGEIAAGRADPSGVDHLSALPDDPLVHILQHLDTAVAVRTSVLSRRWRRVWTLLPKLQFDIFPDTHPVASALAVHNSALRFLKVEALDATPETVAAWLPTAASRLYDLFFFKIRVNEDDERGALELPCFERATRVVLDLEILRLALPSAGVFARLTELYLLNFRIHGSCKLSDAVSSPRCPCLQKLVVYNLKGLDEITIRSESLLLLDLSAIFGLQQLTVVAPALKELSVILCCYSNQIQRKDTNDPSFEMEHLQSLSTFICPYGLDGFIDSNLASLKLLQHYKAVECLSLVLYYPLGTRSTQYMMEDLRMLPQTTLLRIKVVSGTHAFGANLFHLLKICTGVRRLQLDFSATKNKKAQDACPSDCACDQSANWKTEELVLNGLQSIVISDMKGTDHEVAFVQRFFNWTMVPTEITFSCSISKSKARELHRTLSTFCKPGVSLKCYVFHNEEKKTRYLLGPEELGATL